MRSRVFLVCLVLTAGTGPAAMAAGKKPPRPPLRILSPVPRAVPAPAFTAEKTSAGKEAAPLLPCYVANLASVNDFVLFANGGGWDGNWYVGYNTCWVCRLPAPPPAPYARAFIGARLGRMKTEAIPGRPPWEKRPIPGEIDIAVSQEPLWPQSRRYLLASSENIPLEGDSENAMEGVGESHWFWTEVPLESISFTGDNYVALFSPSEPLTDSQHAPILAAGWGGAAVNAWLNSSVKGGPPAKAEEALKTGVSYFSPGVAIKLVPPNSLSVEVSLVSVSTSATGDKIHLSANVNGRNIQSAWVEFSTDTRSWRRAAAVWGPPYQLSVAQSRLPLGTVWLRVAAADEWENRGESVPVKVEVTPPPTKKQ